MAATRTERLELRLTPAQKELIEKGASKIGKTTSAYALDVLVAAALGDAASEADAHGALGWMRGTATIVGDIVGPTEEGGWTPGDFPE